MKIILKTLSITLLIAIFVSLSIRTIQTMQKTALLSVSDKSGLVPFAKALVEQHGYRLLSTGGTAKLLEKEGIPVT